jgi:hypothetical protein
MHGEFILPNWHVILIHYPLALLTVGVVIELLSFFWRASSVRIAGRWMILIGALASIPTVTMGIYGLRDVVVSGPIDDSQTWKQVVSRSRWTTQQWEHMDSHIWLAASGTAVAVLAAFIWLACSDRGRQRFYWPALILVVLGLALMNWGAWHSGEGIYRHGVAIHQESPDVSVVPAALPAVATTTSAATQPAAPAPAADQQMMAAAPRPRQDAGPRTVEYYIPPLQLHLLLAGMTVAIALGAFGLTLRRWAILRCPVAPPGTRPDLAEHRLRPDLRSVSVAPPADPSPGIVPLPAIYPARLWLWALVFGLGTVAAGLWATGDWRLAGADRQGQPFQLVTEPFRNKFALQETGRLFGHVMVGSSIVLLLLLGAILTRVAPRHRGLTVLLMLLGVIAVAGQMWLGILMLFDSVHGPVTRFN